MFSRVANTVARAPLRAAASRRLSSSAVAAVTSQASSSTIRLGASVVAVAAGLAFAADNKELSPALCAAASFPYTGAPGTANERSFIVSNPSLPSSDLVLVSRIYDSGPRTVTSSLNVAISEGRPSVWGYSSTKSAKGHTWYQKSTLVENTATPLCGLVRTALSECERRRLRHHRCALLHPLLASHFSSYIVVPRRNNQ